MLDHYHLLVVHVFWRSEFGTLPADTNFRARATAPSRGEAGGGLLGGCDEVVGARAVCVVQVTPHD